MLSIHFYIESLVITDVIQTIISLFVLIVTVVMACIANKALKEWKHQKEFDINMEGLANAFTANQLVHSFLDINYNKFTLSEADQEELKIVLEYIPEAEKPEIALKNYYRTKRERRDELLEVLQVAQKAVSSSSNIKMQEFYNAFLIHHITHYSQIPAMLQQIINDLFVEKGYQHEILKEQVSSDKLATLKKYYSPENVDCELRKFDQLYINLVGEKFILR